MNAQVEVPALSLMHYLGKDGGTSSVDAGVCRAGVRGAVDETRTDRSAEEDTLRAQGSSYVHAEHAVAQCGSRNFCGRAPANMRDSGDLITPWVSRSDVLDITNVQKSSSSSRTRAVGRHAGGAVRCAGGGMERRGCGSRVGSGVMRDERRDKRIEGDRGRAGRDAPPLVGHHSMRCINSPKLIKGCTRRGPRDISHPGISAVGKTARGRQRKHHRGAEKERHASEDKAAQLRFCE
ncbi:hypothetical protein B0H10DRAFT_1946297 [Mycena sp. CBHHK59/15]|nr:hypothetical protein B0H10DRAFT_1946297 [Mycena sp. CBHHK59/15]